ncbi:MAG TPA: hypothetical protein VGN52_11420 [Burkholderiales bacterium]|jgi:hypothetical protein
MPEREFDGQLAVAPTQSALLQAAQEKLAALAHGLNAMPYGAQPRPDPPREPQSPGSQAAPSRSAWL